MVFSLFPLLAFSLSLLAISAVSYYGIARNSDVIIQEVNFLITKVIFPVYEATLKIIVDFIHSIFNPTICFWDLGVLWPQQIGRNVVIPTFLECGLLDFAISIGNLLSALGRDWIVNHVASGAFFTLPLDTSNICTQWQTMIDRLQTMLCCGCMDLCVAWTSLPVIPMVFTSDQLKSVNWWCFIDNMSNGILILFQEFLRIIQVFIFSAPGSARPNLRPAFDRFCAASTCFFKSWEEILQQTWIAFVPYEFVWNDFLCVFDKYTCIMLRATNLMMDIVFHIDLVRDHFTASSPLTEDYWRDSVKEDFKDIINSITMASTFSVITEVNPVETFDMIIEPYNDAVSGNTLSECMCIFAERMLCDPLADGTTCAQRFNNTLLSDIDVCCFGELMDKAFVDTSSFIFEATLHLYTASDFVIFLDRQPFSKFIKESVVNSIACLFQIFRSIEDFGLCIERVLTESVVFIGCFIELNFRVTIAVLTLPFFEANLPTLDNFITRPGDEALNESLEFLRRIADVDNPQGFINCLCYLINIGFSVPPAGCQSEPLPCEPTGFVDPLSSSTRRRSRNVISKHKLTPIMSYGKSKGSPQGAAKAFASVIPKMDLTLTKMAEGRLSTLAPNNITGDCSLCFNACCLPTRVVIVVAETSEFVFRAINAAFQNRFGAGSEYWNGEGCSMGPNNELLGTCLASDLTRFIGNVIAPITCICNFIQLVIPPIPGIDPCCLFTLVGDLIGCLIVIGINIVNSIASDPTFQYIKDDTMLIADFDIVAVIAVSAFECACDGIRTIFGFIQSSIDLNSQFDPCCIPQKIFVAVVDGLRLVFQIVLSISTLEQESSNCFLFVQDLTNPLRVNCVVSVDQLPIVQRVDAILDVLLAPPSAETLAQCSGDQNVTTSQDQSVEGIATCYCTLINNVLNAVFQNSELNSSCPLNLCCIIYRVSDLVLELARFSIRLAASIWQNWEKVEYEIDGDTIETDIPAGFIDFFLCNEYFPGGSVALGEQPPYNIDALTDKQQKCGRTEPILRALDAALSSCLCSDNPDSPGLADVLDSFLQYFLFTITNSNQIIFGPNALVWPKCFCQGGRNGAGIVRPLSNVIVVALRQILILTRNIANPSYWRPADGSFLSDDYADTLINNVEDVQNSWIARFLGPFADSLCQFITNLGCFLSMILGDTCEPTRYNVLASAIRYLLEAVIKALVLIEGFIKLFLQELPGICIGDQSIVTGGSSATASDGNMTVPACSPTNVIGTIFGIPDPESTDKIQSIIVATLQFVVDATIGIGSLGCTSTCPVREGGFTVVGSSVTPSGPACNCYANSVYKAPETAMATFEACRLAFNLPANESVCGGVNVDSCDFNTACGNPVGTNTFPTQGPLEFQTTFVCARSLSGGTYGPGDEERYRALTNWVIPQLPITYPYQQLPSACGRVLEPDIITPDGPVSADIATDFPISDLQNPETRYKGVILIPNSQSSWSVNGATSGFIWNPSVDATFAPNGYCQLVEPMGGTVPTSIIDLARAYMGPGIGSNATAQPLCTREYCYTNGFCKNDQMVACSPNEDILDGIVMAFLKYLICLTEELRITILEEVLRFAATLVSIIWQYSAGIIKLVVSIAVLTVQFMINLNPLAKLLFGVFIIIDFFEGFVAIISQPVVVGFGSDPQPFLSRNTQGDAMFSSIRLALGENLDGCLENPIECFCEKMQCSEEKENTDPTLSQVIDFMSVVFSGNTECDALVRNVKSEHPTQWSDIPFSERYQYVDCIGKHVQGERYNRISAGIWPKDFFYSPDGWYKLILNSHKATVEYTRKNHEEHVRKRSKKKRKRDVNDEVDKIRKFSAFYKGMQTRAEIAKRVMHTKVGISKDSIAYTFTVEMDRMWYKYRSGYFNYITENAIKRYRTEGLSPIFGSFSESLKHVGDAFVELKRGHGAAKMHFNDAKHAFNRMINGGEPKEKAKSKAKIKAPEPPLRFRKFESSGGVNLKNPMQWPDTRHMGSIYNLKVDPGAIQSLYLRDPEWTRKKTFNYEMLTRMYYGIVGVVAPHYVTRDIHERFILEGDCRLVNDAVEETSMMLDFCLNNWAYNLPNTTYNTSFGTRMARYVKSAPNKYKSRGDWVDYRGSKRYRLHSVDEHRKYILKRRQLRQLSQGSSALPANFNLIEWTVCQIEDIFSISASNSIAELFDDIRAFLANPSTDAMDYPNVGAAYYLQAFTTCSFPNSISCMIGIGIEEAIFRVTIVYIVVIVALTVTGLSSILTLIFSFFIYWFAVLFVAYHWTPICLLPFPSYTTGFGVSITYLPITTGFWALPVCLWDDLKMLLEKYISPCLDFIIPQSLVIGPVCPAGEDARIIVRNCLDVGVGDGLTNVLYFGFKIFGTTFCDIILTLSQTFIGRLAPAINEYLNATLNTFKLATAEELEALGICATLTIGTIGWVIVIGILVSSVVLFVVPVIYGIVASIFNIFTQTNVYESVVSQGQPTEYDVLDFEDEFFDDEGEDEDDEPTIASQTFKIFTGLLERKKLRIQ